MQIKINNQTTNKTMIEIKMNNCFIQSIKQNGLCIFIITLDIIHVTPYKVKFFYEFLGVLVIYPRYGDLVVIMAFFYD